MTDAGGVRSCAALCAPEASRLRRQAAGCVCACVCWEGGRGWGGRGLPLGLTGARRRNSANVELKVHLILREREMTPGRGDRAPDSSQPPVRTMVAATFLTAFLVTLVVYLRQGAAGLRTPSEADWPENIDLFLGWSGPAVAQKNVDDQAPRSDDTARDRDNGELEYFLRSVALHAPGSTTYGLQSTPLRYMPARTISDYSLLRSRSRHRD